MFHLAKPAIHILFLVELIRRLCLHTVLHGLAYSAGCEQVVMCDSSGAHNVGYGDLALTKNIKKKEYTCYGISPCFFGLIQMHTHGLSQEKSYSPSQCLVFW